MLWICIGIIEPVGTEQKTEENSLFSPSDNVIAVVNGKTELP